MSDPDFYPLDFPVLQGGNAPETTDGQLASIRTEIFEGAIDQATNRRLIGQQTIQNQASLAIHDRVPFTVVGKNTTNVLFLGTAGYFLGGQDTVPGVSPHRATSLHRTSFLSEHFERIGAGMVIGREFAGTAGNGSVAFTLSGWTPTLNDSTLRIEKLDQVTSVMTLIGANASQGRFACTGYGTKTHGYYLGGVHYSTQTASLNIDKLSYTSELISVLGATLGSVLYPARTTAGDATRMAIFASTKIHSLNFNTETLSLTGTFPSVVDGVHGACTGNSEFIWHNGYAVSQGNSLSSLNRFRLSDNSLTLLGVFFPLRSEYKAAMGSSAFGYWNVGRVTPYSDYHVSSDLVDKVPSFSPGAESVVPIGSRLTQTKGQSEGTAISDYAASYS